MLYRESFRCIRVALSVCAAALLAFALLAPKASAAAGDGTASVPQTHAVTVVSGRSHDLAEGRFADHDRLFVVAGGEAIQVWETAHWQLVREIPIYGVAGFPFAVDAQARRAVVRIGTSAIVVDLHDGSFLRTLAFRGPVQSVAISDDGRTIVAGAFGTARIIRLGTESLDFTLHSTGHVALTNDGRRAAVSLERGAVSVLDVGAGQRRYFALPRDRAATAGPLAFSLDGTLLAQTVLRLRGKGPADISVWNVHDGTLLRRLRTVYEPYHGRRGAVFGLNGELYARAPEAVSPRGYDYATVGYDLPTGNRRTYAVDSLTLSFEHELVATGAEIDAFPTAKKLFSLPPRLDTARSVGFGHGGLLGMCLATPQGSVFPVLDLGRPDAGGHAKRLFSIWGACDDTIDFTANDVSVYGGMYFQRSDNGDKLYFNVQTTESYSVSTEVAFSTYATLVVSGTEARYGPGDVRLQHDVALWDTRIPGQSTVLTGFKESFGTFGFLGAAATTDGNYVLATGETGPQQQYIGEAINVLRRFDLPARKATIVDPFRQGYANGAAFASAPTGSTVAVAADFGAIKGWSVAILNVADMHVLRRYGPLQSLTGLAFLADGKSVAFGDANHIEVRSLADDTLLTSFAPRINGTGPIARFSVAPDGRTVAIAFGATDAPAPVRFFNLTTGSEVLTLMFLGIGAVPADRIDFAAWTPDGRYDGTPALLRLLRYSDGGALRPVDPTKRVPGLLSLTLGKAAVIPGAAPP